MGMRKERKMFIGFTLISQTGLCYIEHTEVAAVFPHYSIMNRAMTHTGIHLKSGETYYVLEPVEEVLEAVEERVRLKG